MSRWDKTTRENGNHVGSYYYKQQMHQYPSFSSSLLEEIYRSIDAGDGEEADLRFYREAAMRRDRAAAVRCCGVMEQEERWVPENFGKGKGSEKNTEVRRRSKNHRTRQDRDALFFTSSSSDSSSSGFSSSDTEGRFGKRLRQPSCFAPPRPKPVGTGGSKRPGRDDWKQSGLFHESRGSRRFENHCERSETDDHLHGSSLIKSKTRATKIYNHLKRVKQPISPGGKLASFINFIFASKKPLGKDFYSPSSPTASFDRGHFERRQTSGQVSVSACSSASSFSRSCLSKHSPSTRQRLRNGAKRSVTFCPVSLIADEDLRPYGQLDRIHRDRSDDGDENGCGSTRVSVSLPRAWKIGKPPARKEEESLRASGTEKTRRSVEKMAREILKEYESRNAIMEDGDDDDAASCSSSDLFELDHRFVIGDDDPRGGLYGEELPVYGTTDVETNRAIAHCLIV